MYIATVIPLMKGSYQKEYLSYFSVIDIPLGSIVSIPVRSKIQDAIVVNITEARDIKTDIKNADFQIKKIIKVKGQSPFDKNFFLACKNMASYLVSNTGSVIKSLLPAVFIENLNHLKNIETESQLNNENIRHEKVIFQTSLPDRLAFYRTLIREAFAKKESIFICLPTHFDINYFNQELSKGIEKYVFSFYSKMKEKILINQYNSVVLEKHPILIIGTGIFLSIPRNDIKTIILEKESSDIYKQISRPYLDIRNFAEVLSSIKKIKLIFGDTMLRPETLYRHNIGEFGEIASPLYRLSQTENQKIIDMRDETSEIGKKIFKIISSQTEKIMSKSLEEKKSVFLFSVRKGLAPITICNDCNQTLLCPNCLTPIVLYGSKQITANKSITSRVFMCNKCGHKETTEIRCPYCSSWNLTPLGIGTDKVYEEIRNLFPKIKIIQIDKESTPTIKDAEKAIIEFHKNPGSILIGTEMVFSYIEKQINNSVVVSLDGLLSIPNFNITQKILHIIEKLHSMTLDNLIIQTRVPENKILQHILSGNILPLHREDLEDRKNFGYPPFKRLIKITFEGSKLNTEKARIFIEKILNNYDPQIFSAFLSKIKGQYITNTIIKIDPKIWPLPINEQYQINKELLENLSKLSPGFLINVDPEDLL